MTQYDLGQVVGATGKGISSITKTGTSGLIDTYTITYSDNTTSTFTVTNGASSGTNVYYGTCTTSAGTQVKEVTTSSDYVLETGTELIVKFTNGQTYNSSSSNPVQLKVNGNANVDVEYVSGNKGIRYHWSIGEIVQFVYDGTNFVMVNEGAATTTYWGLTKLEDSVSSTSTGTSATPNAVKQAYDLANGKANAVHQHDYTDLNNISTETVTVTYTDNSTATFNLLKYTPPSS